MKLSIVIPVYRVESTLDRCVNSVVSQDIHDFEVILVDDGSPDACPRMCDEWAARSKRVTVVHQQNGGLSAARNAGIRRAQGEFITFVDSDDFVEDGTYRKLMALTDEADIVEFPVWLFFGTPRQRLLTFHRQHFSDADDYWLQTKAYQHTYAWNKIYRRCLFRDVSFPEGKVFEDVYTLPRLLKQKPRVMTTDAGAYYYCYNPEGITATAKGEQLRMLLEAHLTAAMPVDNEYYMLLVNIQMDVSELTGDAPRLPKRYVKPFGGLKKRLKAIALNKIGIKNLCRITKILHCFKKPSRW